jgi:hypothetical protein
VRSAAALVAECVNGTDTTRLQTILMLMPDKVCAVAFATLSEDRRRSLCTLLGGTKAGRIKEEIRLEARRKTSAEVRSRIIRSFLSYFGKARAGTAMIWIRPKRRS